METNEASRKNGLCTTGDPAPEKPAKKELLNHRHLHFQLFSRDRCPSLGGQAEGQRHFQTDHYRGQQSAAQCVSRRHHQLLELI
jgi:hypothetical protein